MDKKNTTIDHIKVTCNVMLTCVCHRSMKQNVTRECGVVFGLIIGGGVITRTDRLQCNLNNLKLTHK